MPKHSIMKSSFLPVLRWIASQNRSAKPYYMKETLHKLQCFIYEIQYIILKFDFQIHISVFLLIPQNGGFTEKANYFFSENTVVN